MKKFIFVLSLFSLLLPAFAQSRDDIRIYIPPVMSTDPRQAQYFKENFDMETTAAGYTVTNDSGDADYTLHLEVQPNMILYDDGTTEPAPPEEGLYLLQLNLVRNEDSVEIVAFSFPFTNVEEMYEYNLYLLYEAMANVPLTKLVGDGSGIDDRWRNKWIYFRASLDYPITFYQLVTSPAVLYTTPQPGSGPEAIPLDHKIGPWLAFTAGIEIQYFNWMSTELSFHLSFSDAMSTTFIPVLQIEQKFPIKPVSLHWLMIEPYAVAAFPTPTSTLTESFPSIGVGGGVQFAVKAGNSGGAFIDINFIYYLGEVVQDNIYKDSAHYNTPSTITYNRFVIGLGIGYKFGIIDRPGKEQTPASYSLIPPPPPASDVFYYDDPDELFYDF